MTAGIVVGMSLISIGLVLLSHLSYSELAVKPLLPTTAEGVKPKEEIQADKNNCFLPMCFFSTNRVRNHETWVVTCLLSGCLVLLMSLA